MADRSPLGSQDVNHRNDDDQAGDAADDREVDRKVTLEGIEATIDLLGDLALPPVDAAQDGLDRPQPLVEPFEGLMELPDLLAELLVLYPNCLERLDGVFDRRHRSANVLDLALGPLDRLEQESCARPTTWTRRAGVS